MENAFTIGRVVQKNKATGNLACAVPGVSVNSCIYIFFKSPMLYIWKFAHKVRLTGSISQFDLSLLGMHYALASVRARICEGTCCPLKFIFFWSMTCAHRVSLSHLPGARLWGQFISIFCQDLLVPM